MAKGPRTENRKIGDRYYVVTQMPPSRAIPLQIQLGTLIAPVLPSLAGMASDGKEQVLVQAVSIAAEQVAKNMSPKEFYDLAVELIQDSGYVLSGDTLAEVGPVIFEQEFMGDDLSNLYPVLAFILEVNYAKFFTALSGAKEVLRETLKAV